MTKPVAPPESQPVVPCANCGRPILNDQQACRAWDLHTWCEPAKAEREPPTEPLPLTAEERKHFVKSARYGLATWKAENLRTHCEDVLRYEATVAALENALDDSEDRRGADLTEARGRIAALEAQVHTMMDQDIDWINREAAICEEDVGFEETIHVLRKKLTAALADCRTLAKLASGGSIKDRFGSLEAHDDAVNRRDFYIREDQRLKETP